jgi:hypothetical protein
MLRRIKQLNFTHLKILDKFRLTRGRVPKEGSSPSNGDGMERFGDLLVRNALPTTPLNIRRATMNNQPQRDNDKSKEREKEKEQQGKERQKDRQ